jgi:hypothetical protein
MIQALAPVPIPIPRGVYSYVEQPSGETVYLAVTSTGGLLNNELRRRMEGETDAIIKDEMWKDLDNQDAVIGRPTLSVSSGGLARRGPSRPA